MSFTGEIKGGIDKGQGTAMLYAGLIGLFLSDILPTPADGIYFFSERRLRDKWKKGEITPKAYWEQTALLYYALNPLWWLLVGSIIIATKGDAMQKLKTAGWIIGGGIVAGVIIKNVSKDTKQLKLEKEEKLELLKQHPEIIEILSRPEFKNIGQMLKSNK